MSAGFYERTRAVSARLLAPTSAGGMGQGTIKLVRYLPGTAPSNPWEPSPEPSRSVTTLNGVARGVAKELVGLPVENGGQIVATDLMVVVSPWDGAYDPADVLELDGDPVTILKVENVPAVGIVCAVKFTVRR